MEMRQHEVRSDLTFHFVESSSAGLSPVQRGVLLQQPVERVQSRRQIQQESSLIVHQTGRTLKLAEIGRMWSAPDCVHL